jgi:hypothetical protein
MSHRSESKRLPRTKRGGVLVGFALHRVSIYLVYSGRCRFFQSPHFVESTVLLLYSTGTGNQISTNLSNINDIQGDNTTVI